MRKRYKYLLYGLLSFFAFLAVALLVVIYFVTRFEAQYKITYDEFKYSFPAELSFKNISWDADSVSSGNLDSLHLNVAIRELFSKKIKVRDLWLSDGKLTITQPKSSESNEKPNLAIDNFTIKGVSVIYESEDIQSQLIIAFTALHGLKLDQEIYLRSFHTEGLRAEILIKDDQVENVGYQSTSGLPDLNKIPEFSLDTIRVSGLEVRVEKANSINSGSFNFLLTNWSKHGDFNFGIDTLYGQLGDSITFNARMNPSKWSNEGGVEIPGASVRSGASVVNLGTLSVSGADLQHITAELDDSFIAFKTIDLFYQNLDSIIRPEFAVDKGISLHGKVALNNSALSLDSLFFNIADVVPGFLSGTTDLKDSLRGFELKVLEVESTVAGLRAMLTSMPDLPQLRQNEQLKLHASAKGHSNEIDAHGTFVSVAGAIGFFARTKPGTAGNPKLTVKAESQNLRVPLLLALPEIPVKNLAFDLELTIEKAKNGASIIDTKLYMPYVQYNKQEITNINIITRTIGDNTKIALELNDAFAELSVRGTILQEDTLRINWYAEIDCVQPSGYAGQISNWFYKGDLDGTVEKCDSFLVATLRQPLDATLSDADTSLILQAFSGMFMQSGQYIDLNVQDEKQRHFLNFSSESLPYIARSPKWRDVLDSLPVFHLALKAEMDSTLGNMLMGAPAEFQINRFEIDKAANGRVAARGEIPVLALGKRSVNQAAFDLTYRDKYIRGFLNAGAIGNGNDPITNTRLEITDHTGYVVYSLQSDGMKSTGPTHLAIRQTDTPQHTKLTIENNAIKLLGEDWQAQAGDSILFDRDWHLLSGLMELNNNKAFLRFMKTGSSDYTIGIDSVDVAYLLSFITNSPDITGSINGEISLNNTADSVQVLLKTDQLKWRGDDMDQITVSGSYLNQKAIARLDALGDGSKSWIDASYDNILKYKGGFQNFRLGWLSSFLPSGFEISGNLNGNFQGVFPPSEDDGGLIYFTNTSIISPYHKGPLTINSNSITASHGKIYANQFGVSDAYDHELQLNGYLQFSPELKYHMNLISNRFTFIDTGKEGQYNGHLNVSANIDIRSGNEAAVISGNVDVLPGGWFQLIQSDESFTMEEQDEVVVFTSFNTAQREEEEEIAPPKVFLESAVIDLGIGSTEVEIVLNPTSREFVKFQSEGKLAATKAAGQELSLSGRIYSNAGKAMVSLPIVPSINMNINEVIVLWTGDPALPLISFKGSEIFKTTLSGVPGFENRVGLVPVQLFITLEEVKPDNIAFNLGLQSNDPELKGFLDNQPAENIRYYATNLLVFGKLSTDGETGSTMALNSVTKKLNELSQRNLRYTDLIFSVERGVAAEADGSQYNQTRLNYTLQRSLINDRLKLALDGDLGLISEGSNAAPSSHFIGSFNLSYRLSPTSSWSTEASRRNRYAGVIDGEITQYQFGFRFGKSYPTIGDMFRKTIKTTTPADEK